MTVSRKPGAYHPHYDYPVGYGLTPAHSRFKPGQSGNPRGKPKGRKKLGTVLQAVLNEKVSIREGDAIRKVSKAEAMVRAVILKGMKGDPKAFATVIALCQQIGEFESDPEPIDVIRRVLVYPNGVEEDLPGD